MKSLFFLLPLLLVACMTPQAELETPSVSEPVQLFDGESFEGWEGNLDWFRIEDEAIVAGTFEHEIPDNQFLCTIKRYDNFILSMETRLLNVLTNAGVQFHTERIPDHHEVIGYQADLGGPSWWGGLYDESRRNTMLYQADQALIDSLVTPEEWLDYEIHAEGNRVRISINGVQTTDYTEEDPEIPLEGHICVQIHSGPPGEAWYRDIWIEEL